MEILKPTFGDTESYHQIRDFSDTIVSGLRFLSTLAYSEPRMSEYKAVEEFANEGERKLNTKDLNEATEALPEALDDSSIDVFNL